MFYATNIKLIRKNLGCTQQEFLRITNLTRGRLQSYEQGRVEPPFSLLIALQELTNISISDIIMKELKDEDFTRDSSGEVGLIPYAPKDFISRSDELYNFNELVREVKALREKIEGIEKRLSRNK